MTSQAAETLFAELVSRFAADSSVTLPAAGRRGKFGASALKVEGRIFAMLSGGELVLKLPKHRVDSLVAPGIGRSFDPGHGRVMKEWVTIAPDHGRDWLMLAEEARQFVAASKPGSRRRSA